MVVARLKSWNRRPGEFGPSIFLVSQNHALGIIGRMGEITRILTAIEQGDGQAAGQLLPLVYDELRRLAAQKLAGEAPGQTLQPTALVHEAFLRLVGTDTAAKWNGRNHFFAAAAEAMRRLLIDNARRKQTKKRGGGHKRQVLDAVAAVEPDDELLALDEARSTKGAPGLAALLRRAHGRPGGRGSRNLRGHGRPALGIRQGLASKGGPWALTSLRGGMVPARAPITDFQIYQNQ
jgi:RNA polymerase sigma factor (TIGR02999 family)